MIKRVTLLLAGLGLLTACGSDGNKSVVTTDASHTGGATGTGGTTDTGGSSNTANDTATDPNCASNEALICAADLTGFPFVRVALKGSDYCRYVGNCTGVPPTGETTVSITQPKAGTLCLAGTVSPDGWALLALEVAEKTLDRKKILQPFDATSHGITQVTMTIDPPPAQGLDLQLNMVQKLECPSSPADCFYPPNFDFKTITAPSTVTAVLSDFKATDSSQVLDSSVLHSFLLQVNGAGPFDFCIHDFAFLDASNNVVTP
jgi:hypothetical protein